MDRMKVALFLMLIVTVALGCKEKPVLDEAAQSFVDAQLAIEAGDEAKALELLDKSIDLRPDVWAYHERAKLHSNNGDDELAIADIDAGLELDPENADLKYLKKELKKPQKSRFKKAPPMSSK